VLVRRAAPVQVSYCGYPHSTGVAGVDYRLIDSITDPPGAEDLATERLVRLDPCFLCRAEFEELPAPRYVAPVGQRPVTFGSFNNLAKLTSGTIDAWAELLCRQPGAHLLLKAGALGDDGVRRRVSAEFVRRGVREGCLELMDRVPTRREHLALYDRVDVALDTYPYQGTATTCEALLMGVPVVTLLGDRHAARVGGSLLAAIGRPQWIGSDWQEYLGIASRLVGDPPRLAEVHRVLPGQVRESTLYRAEGFVRRLEVAYGQMWREYLAQTQHAQQSPCSR